MHTFFLFLSLLCTVPFTTFAGTIVHDSILISGTYREYKLFLPANYSVNAVYPLVINLHARCSNMNEHITYTDMNSIADTANFIVVYPQGLEDPNDPFDCIDWNDNGRHSWDDVAFISALIDKLIAENNVSADRVYSCGFSRGGALCYTLACELSSKIAGIAVISGGFSINPLINSVNYSCQAASAKPILIMHGDIDPDINYNGYPNYWAPVDSILSFWENKNNCAKGFTTIQIPNNNTTDNCSVTQYIYNNCPLIFYKIVDGRHSWPGSQGTLLIEIPPKNLDIIASLEIWNFFKSIQIVSGAENYTISQKTTVFPNPFTDKISLSTSSTSENIILYNSWGKIVWKGQNIENHDFSSLPSGIYILSISGEKKNETLKLIKE